MIKLSNIYNNITEFIERVKSADIWNDDKQYILDILNTSYKISNIKNWKDLYNILLDGFTKNLLDNKFNFGDYVSLFDYSEDELNFIYEYINQSEDNRLNFIKLSISKILKSDKFQEFIKSLSLNKYDTSKLNNLEVIEEEAFKKKYTKYIVNGYEIGQFISGHDYYTPKSNSRSDFMDFKKATDLSFNQSDIIKLMNNIFGLDDENWNKIYSIKDVDKIFKDDFHAPRYRYTGPKKPSKQSIIDKLYELYGIIQKKLNN